MALAVRSAAEKLSALRKLMTRHNFAAYVIPSTDAHSSEYIAPHDARREFISGFSGSAGTAVVTAADAKLWTDGRYFLQATKQLDASAGWALMKAGLPETPSIEAWLASSLAAGEVVGLDPTVTTLGSVKTMRATLEKKGIRLCTTLRSNLVDEVWGAEQPPAPSAPVMVQTLRYTGSITADKVARVQAALAKEGASALVVTALDEIAWLFNIRGGDIECNPVTMAYAIVQTTEAAAAAAGASGGLAAEAALYIDAGKLSDAVRAHIAEPLASGGAVSVRGYDAVWADAAALQGKVWVDPAYCNYAIFEAVSGRGDAAAAAAAAGGAGAPASSPAAPAAAVAAAAGSADDSQVLQSMSPIQLMKALKNGTEADGMRAAHVRDGAALTAFFAWLEAALHKGVDARTGAALPAGFALNEFSVCPILESFRAAQADFAGLSFPTIAGSGANGAIIHYRPEEASAARITTDSVFLCDSGAQYRDGTTDVTRTLHFGAPSAHEKRCYTRVLQGHIGLARARFPTGATGQALDAFARAPLWQDGLDYRHGTGHGVGSFLNVHEGPFGISPQVRNSYTEGAKAGMVLSNEPGYYEDGAFGVRIENLVITVEAPTPFSFGGKPYLAFENLTMVPMCRALIDVDLLTKEDVGYLNEYHAAVRRALAPLLADNAVATAFLMRETEPL